MSDSGWTSRSARGAASELIAAVHLMEQGYHVFRCVAPACPFDLIAYRDGQFLRVEVKSASQARSPRYAPSAPWPSNDEWDLLVVVGVGGRVVEIDTHDPVEGRRLIKAELELDPVTRLMVDRLFPGSATAA